MVQFGSFRDICREASLLVCPILGKPDGPGLETDCFPRNIDVDGFLIFQSGK
jgi:hypothetical protein